MAITKYRAWTSMSRIEQVEVLRETEQCVFLEANPFGRKAAERREAKRSDFWNYFDTWASAHAFLLDDANDKLIDARRDLQSAQDRLGNIKGMKESSQKKEVSNG